MKNRPRLPRLGLRPLAVAIATIALIQAPPAVAGVVLDTLNFASGTQSIWGSGGSASFGGSGYLIGSNRLGVSYDAGASTGTVRSSVSGQLKANFADEIRLGSATSIGFDFFGNPLGGRLVGSLGAGIEVKAHLNTTLVGVPVGWNPTLMDLGYRLDIDETFTGAVPKTVRGSDAFTPASVGIGLPTFGIGLGGGAGVDLDIQQTAELILNSLTGRIDARHRDTGTVVSRLLSITSPAEQFLDFDLGLTGEWDFSYGGLTLGNQYSTQFALNALPYIEYGVGVYCGDLGDDDDNILCTDEKLRRRVAGIDLFSSADITIDYGALDFARAFTINVLDLPTGVPEPGTLWMALAGTGWLVVRRRRAGAKA